MAYTQPIQVDFDKVYESNTYGPFKIIENLGRDARSRLFVKVKFLNTGTEKVVRYDTAMDGKVSDDLYGIDFDRIYDSVYYGKFRIIKYVGRNHESKRIVRIKFLNTGFEYDVLLKQVLKGFVKDYSVDFKDRIFDPSPENRELYLKSLLMGRWRSIISRCYDPKNIKYYDYGAIGVSVCEEWKDFNTFLETVKFLPNFEKFCIAPMNYHIDKDYLQQTVPKSNRVYSPKTCMFLSMEDNDNLAIKEKHTGGYYGVRKQADGKFNVEFSVNGIVQCFGTYSNEHVAASEYNYYYRQYGIFELVPLLNCYCPFITHEDAQAYLVNSVANSE